MNLMSFTTAPARARIETIKRLLEEGDQTIASISEKTFISRRWAREYLDHMRDNGAAHIARYQRELIGERTYPRAVFRIGPGKDAKKPSPFTSEQKSARRRQRRKDDPEYYLRERAANRLRRMKPKPDQAAAWLFQ